MRLSRFWADRLHCYSWSNFSVKITLLFPYISKIVNETSISPFEASVVIKVNFLIHHTHAYPENRGFSWHAKNWEKRKTSQEIVSKSCWVCAMNRPVVWTSHTGETGCVTGFSPLPHSCAWTVCISADQNEMAREEIGLQPRSKVILRHAQQDFDTISPEAFLFSPFFACQGKPLLSG